MHKLLHVFKTALNTLYLYVIQQNPCGVFPKEHFEKINVDRQIKREGRDQELFTKRQLSSQRQELHFYFFVLTISKIYLKT